MKSSIVIPAHNEAGSIEETVQLLASTLEAERIEFELLVVGDGSSDGTAEAVSRAKADDARIRCVRSTYPRGFGFAVRAGLEQFTGDAVAIVMADGSDPPQDLVRYHRLLEEGYDCAFGSRSVKGAKVRDYPRFKLVLNRAASLHPRALPPRLRRHDERVQGVSPRGRRDSPASPVGPLQPDCRDAAEGDSPWP